MYDTDTELDRPITAEELAGALNGLLLNADEDHESNSLPQLDADPRSLQAAGYMTNDDGLEIRFVNGQTFLLTIQLR